MDGIGTLLLVVLAIILMAVLAWAALYGIALYRARRYREQAMRIRHLLESADAYLAQQEIAANQYPVDSPEPYGPLAQDLAARLQRTRADHRDCLAQFAHLQQTVPELPAEIVRQIVAVFWPHLRDWQRHARQTRVVEARAQALQEPLARIGKLLDQLRGLPLDVAGRVRGLIGATDRITRIGQTLKEAGVHGESLDTCIANARGFTDTLRTLPAYFLQGTDETVMQSATQDSTREAHAKLRAIERPLYDTLRRLQNWQSQYTEAKNMVGVMQLEIGTAEKVLREVPRQLDVASHTFELQQLRQTAQEIDTQQRTADVEALPDLSNAATQQVMKAKELATHVMALHKTYQSIEQAISANGQWLDRIQSVMDNLAQSPVCPITWENSAAERDRLVAFRERVGGLDVQRNGNRLKSDLDKALELGLQARSLEGQVNDARDQHSQLLALLRSEEAQTRAEWLQETASVHIAATKFAPENWPPVDSVATLRVDALALAKREHDLAPLFDNHPIPESQIRQWIDAMTVYLRERRALSARLGSIDEILQAIQKQEQSAKAMLADTSRGLSELGIESGQLAPGSPSALRWDELIEVWQRGRRLGETLEQRDVGRISDKAVSVEAWSRQCLGAVSNLNVALQAEADQARAQLESRVDALMALAPFDLEATMRAAQSLLEEPGDAEKPATPRQVARAQARPPALSTLAKQAAELWSSLVSLNAALAEVESHISMPLDARPDRLEEERWQALQRLEELERLRKQIPSIEPMPVTCNDADQLQQDYDQAQASVEELKQSGRTVRTVVARLDNLIQQYEYIANRGASVMGEMERDILRLNDVWAQFGQWAQALQRYRNQHKQDKPLATAIEERFAEMDHRFEDIQRRYKGRSLPINYAWQELDALLRDTYRDIDVVRDGQADVVTARTIEAGG